MMPERNCAKCTKKQQREYGCDAAVNEKGEWTNRAILPLDIDGEQTWACPRRPVKDDPVMFSELMHLYGLYREGVLADDGAISSQASRYVKLMRLVHGVVSECNSQKQEDGNK